MIATATVPPATQGRVKGPAIQQRAADATAPSATVPKYAPKRGSGSRSPGGVGGG